MKLWDRTKLEEVFRARVFAYFKTTVTNPVNGLEADFDIIKCANWVNVVALDENEDIILVKQYRAGANAITLETPAGAINLGEDPLNAAKRELEEETGFVSSQWQSLGKVEVNPAIMTNFCYFFLAKNAKLTGQINFDDMEDVQTVLYKKEEVRSFIKSGEISHSLSSLALFKYFSC